MIERSITDSSKSIIKNVVSVSDLKPISPGLPSRLKIPKINIDVALEHVGLTTQGAVDMPKGRSNGAWFDLSPRPGENGNAIITGHYGYWGKDEPAIFNDLYKLQKGDKLYIEDEKGTIIIFIVRELQIYDRDEYAPGVFNSGDGKAHLNLITCDGSWIVSQKTYSNRLIVFTDKE